MIIPACLASLLVTTAAAASDEPIDHAAADHEPFRAVVHFDNDGGLLKRNNPNDRHYTNGFQLELAHRPDWADRIAPHMPFARQFGEAETGGGYLFGQLMFTPDRITVEELIRDDRPYAGYLYGGAFWQRANDRTLDHFQLELGVIGESSLAGPTQEFVHSIYGGEDPAGWDNQLADEPTIQFYLRKYWRLDGPRFDLADVPVQIQFIPHAELALGTPLRHVEAELLGRIGVNLPDDYGPARLDNPGAITGRPLRGFSAYLFGRVAGRLVEHNTFLEGSNFDSSHGVDAETLVGVAQAGLVLQYGWDDWAVLVSYAQTFMTDEFEDQGGGDAFASLAVGLQHHF